MINMPLHQNNSHEDHLRESLDPVTDLKRRLLNEYQDKTLDEVFGGEEIETTYGTTYLIKSRDKIDFCLKKCDDIKKSMIGDLKLIPGIGPATESRLKKEGFTDIEKLQNHPKIGWKAEMFLSKLEEKDSSSIIELVKKNYPSSHERVLECAGYKNPEHFIFMDIETLGLNHQPVILMGEATLKKNEIEVRQYLCRDLGEEPAVLSGITSHLCEESAFVSFNGASFDLPYIKNRLEYFQIEQDLSRTHFDLYHYSRRFWGSNLPNCRLTTIERHLFDIERVDDVPGSHIPGYYKTYQKEDNIGPLVPIIEHNRMDIVTLALILSRMHDEI